MKTCSVTGCNNPVWGRGLCQAHIPRTPLRKAPLTQARIRKVVEEVYNEVEKRNNFFMAIWRIRPHVCQHCGRPLSREPRSYMFDHLLEKNKYPDLEYEPENIWLVCLECHDNKTRGNVSEKYQEKINFVTTKFNVS